VKIRTRSPILILTAVGALALAGAEGSVMAADQQPSGDGIEQQAKAMKLRIALEDGPITATLG
jgi:hypothetical protein